MMAGFTGRASGQGKLELGHLRDLWWCTGRPDKSNWAGVALYKTTGNACPSKLLSSSPLQCVI